MVCPHVHPMGYSGFQFFSFEDLKIWITVFRLFPKGAKSNIVCFQKALNPLFGGACNIWAIGVQHSHIELAHLLFLVSKFQKQNNNKQKNKTNKIKIFMNWHYTNISLWLLIQHSLIFRIDAIQFYFQKALNPCLFPKGAKSSKIENWNIYKKIITNVGFIQVLF